MTIRSKRELVSVTVLVLGLTMLAGCKVVAPGVTYNLITLEALISATPEEVTQAAEDTMLEMKLVLISAEATGLDGKVVARTAQQKKIRIDVKHQGRDISHIKIQVGRLGDQATSMMILDRIKSKL